MKGIKGICTCKKCGSTADVDTSMVLTSFPPQYRYKCRNESCEHHTCFGYILESETEWVLDNDENQKKENDMDKLTDLTDNITSRSISSNISGISLDGTVARPSLTTTSNDGTCNSCTHQAVCKYRKEYEKKVASIKISDLDSFIKIKVECAYYSASMLTVTPYYNTRCTDDDSLKVNNDDPCASCSFKKTLMSGKVYVGDAPCDWCSSNPYKLTCTSTNTEATADTVTKASRTKSNSRSKLVINENSDSISSY